MYSGAWKFVTSLQFSLFQHNCVKYIMRIFLEFNNIQAPLYIPKIECVYLQNFKTGNLNKHR